MEYITTCAAGLEDLVSDEITDWNGQESVSGKGFVRWSGLLEAGYRACLWSRFSSRLVLVLSEFDIADTDDLYEVAKSIIWEDHFSDQDSFAVDCVLSSKTDKAVVTNSMFGGLRVKDGIVDRFREASGRRPSVQVKRPAVKVYVQVEGRKAVLGLDLSGESLHRRGYRVAAGPAPLKENLAAAIIRLSGWDAGSTLLDPMCGSATLLIEAALMHADSAPGLGRSYFGLLGWRQHRPEIWESLVTEALAREEAAQNKTWPRLVGYDGDKTAVRAARKNILRAGLEDRITIEHLEIHRLENRFGQQGFVVCNPPYGERLADKQSVKHLYRFMGSRFQQKFSDWRITVFSASPDYADQFRIDSGFTRRMHNGPLACRLLSGSPLPDPDGGSESFIGPAITAGPGDGSELANRLKKNLKRLHPWAAHHELDCFRLYDRDLPQFNVSVDVIGKHIYISEFPPSSGKDPQAVDERFNQVIRTVRDLFDIGRDRVIIRRGKTRKNKDNKPAIRQKQYEIREGTAVLLANLPGSPETDYVIDQRFVREVIQDLTGQGSFLSLFDTSGAGTVLAALGGAKKTVTAGLSAVNRAALAMNFSRNGMALDSHRVVEEPVMTWLKYYPEPFDCIYVNLRRKTYGRGKSSSFDTVTDHRLLVELAVHRLAAGGNLILSTLVPSFQLDPSLEERYFCRNISRKTFPLDLPKTARNFCCWQISQKDQA